MTTSRFAINSEAPSAAAPSGEPRWPAFDARLATGSLYAALPASLSAGPRWLPLRLFLAFSMSMALSPADTAVLSRWAKGLVMIQAMISLTVVVVVAARAVNVL